MLWLALALQLQPDTVDMSKEMVPAGGEGWVFPSERSQRASSVCPVIGRVTAELVQDAGGWSFTVTGMGRTATGADQQAMKEMLKSLRGMYWIEVSCWGEQAAHITVNGKVMEIGRLLDGRVDFLWTGHGPHPLPNNAIYPSVSPRPEPSATPR